MIPRPSGRGDSFWQNKLLFGILVAVGFPAILIAFRILFVPLPQKKMTVDDLEESFGQLSKLSSAAAIIGSASAIVGSVAAWFHNLSLTMLFGVLVTFAAWGVLQINWHPNPGVNKKSITDFPTKE